VAVLLALLVSQAASSVCAVQCVNHPAMPHCHAMSHGGGALVKNCSNSEFCAVDFLVNRQQEIAGPTGVHVDLRSDIFLPSLAPALFSNARRSSASPPPLMTALRI
jgi:hypothetical protein